MEDMFIKMKMTAQDRANVNFQKNKENYGVTGAKVGQIPSILMGAVRKTHDGMKYIGGEWMNDVGDAMFEGQDWWNSVKNSGVQPWNSHLDQFVDKAFPKQIYADQIKSGGIDQGFYAPGQSEDLISMGIPIGGGSGGVLKQGFKSLGDDIYRGVPKSLKTTHTNIGQDLVLSDFPKSRLVRRIASPLKPFPDITNTVRDKSGFMALTQNPSDKSYFFSSYMTNPRNAGKGFKALEKKIPEGALIKNSPNSTYSDASYSMAVKRANKPNFTSEYDVTKGEKLWLNPYSGKDINEVYKLKTSGESIKVDGNTVKTFPTKEAAQKHVDGINKKLDKADFNIKKVNAEVKPIPGTQEYGIKVPNIGLRKETLSKAKTQTDELPFGFNKEQYLQDKAAKEANITKHGEDAYISSAEAAKTREQDILESFYGNERFKQAKEARTTSFDKEGNIISPTPNDVAGKVKKTSNVADNFKSEIDWGKWNKEIPDNKSLMKEYNAIEQSTKADGTWMKNVDGTEFKGTPEQFVQQKSKNFKKAFPNILKDSPTSPINILTHHSPNEFNAFDEVKKLSGVGQAKYGEGIYTVPKTYYDDFMTQDFKEMASGKKPVYVGYGKNRYDLYANDIGVKQFPVRKPGGVNTHPLPAYKTRPHTAVVPYNNQLKSATGNNGMFDMSNSNIYKSLAPIIGTGALGAGYSAMSQEKALGGAVGDPPVSQYKRLYGHAKDYGVGTTRGLIDSNTGYKYFPEEGQGDFISNQESAVPESPWNLSRFSFQPFMAGEKQGIHNAIYGPGGNYLGTKELSPENAKNMRQSMRQGLSLAKDDLSTYYTQDLGLSKKDASSELRSDVQKLRQMKSAQNKMGSYYFKDFQDPDFIFDESLGYQTKFSPFASKEEVKSEKQGTANPTVVEEMQHERLSPGKTKRAYTKFQKTWGDVSGKDARKLSRAELKEAKEIKEDYIKSMADHYNLSVSDYKKEIKNIQKNKGSMNYNRRLPKKYAGGMIDENQMDTMNKYEQGKNTVVGAMGAIPGWGQAVTRIFCSW